MKKFLAIIAIASFAVACNGSGEKTETKDTTVIAPVVVDSPVVAPVDTTVVKIDTTMVKKDTAK